MFINLKLEKNVIQNKRLITPEIILKLIKTMQLLVVFFMNILVHNTEGIARLFAEQQFAISCFTFP